MNIRSLRNFGCATLVGAGLLCQAHAQNSGSAAGDSADLNSLLGPSPQAQQPAAKPSEPASPTADVGSTSKASAATPVPKAAAKSGVPASAVSAKTGKAAGGAKTEAANANPDGKNRLLEEIVVTAERREENVQDVPIAVTAFSGKKLDAMGIKRTEDLPEITPGLTFQGKAGYSVIFLRGVGTDAFLPAADPNVPVYVDGIPQLSGQGVSNVLGRVKRVEVLKGPQGTLFGRNSTGGAISITTPDPGPVFGGDAQVEFGDYGTLNELVYLDVPITDSIAASVSGYSNRNDNYYNNIGGPQLDVYSRGGRVKLRWAVTDNLTIQGTANYTEESNVGSLVTKEIHPAPIVSAGGILINKDTTPGARNVNQDLAGGDVSQVHVISGQGDWKLPWIELKALGSTQNLYLPFAQWDFDSTNRPIFSFTIDDQFESQNTAEFQILSNDGTPYNQYFSWVAGAFYLTGDGGFPNLLLQLGGANGFGTTGPAILGALPGLAGLIGSTNQLINTANATLGGLGIQPIQGLTGPVDLVSGGVLQTKSISGYFQGTVHLQQMFDMNTPLNIILGARLDSETRGLTEARLGIINPTANPHSFKPEDQVTLIRFSVPDVSALQVPLKAEVQWFPTDLIQVYASFSRGFTSPTYNTVNFFSPPDSLQPEKVNSYELGAKTQLLDQTLTLNTAAFYIQEKQLLTAFLSATSGGIVRFDNVPAARIFGAEFDATWQILPEVDPGLAIFASGTYLNAEYTSYPNGRGYDVPTGLSFGPGAPLPPRDFSGNRIVGTPKFSADVGFNQSFPLYDGARMEVSADMYYDSGYSNAPQNAKLYSTPAYELFNAHVSYFYQPWGLELTAYGKNLSMTNYNTSLFINDFGVEQTYNNPRTYGLQIKYTF